MAADILARVSGLAVLASCRALNSQFAHAALEDALLCALPSEVLDAAFPILIILAMKGGDL